MTYPIGTLLRDRADRYFVVLSEHECQMVAGVGSGLVIPTRSWMTPVPCPPNVAESPTVPDWASSVPLGGMVLK